MTTEPTLESVREFVLAGHFDLAKVQAMLAEQPGLLNLAHEWGIGDYETAIQAAAHVGNATIARFLLARGAPLAICTAAMLGDQDTVTQRLADDPAQIWSSGAHHIPLLAHAAHSGKVDLVEMLIQQGAKDGISYALHNAVSQGYIELVGWMLENTQPDLTWKNYQGKTALAVAQADGNQAMVALLEKSGAV